MLRELVVSLSWTKLEPGRVGADWQVGAAVMMALRALVAQKISYGCFWGGSIQDRRLPEGGSVADK